MNRQLTPDEISKLDVPTMLPMSRREKLLRWASIVRTAPYSFRLYHNLERQTPALLAAAPVNRGDAFAAALDDPTLRDAGLTGPTFGDQMTFFELSQADLHEFSCDCGGTISNAQMADRIEAIANRGLVNGIRRAFAHW